MRATAATLLSLGLTLVADAAPAPATPSKGPLALEMARHHAPSRILPHGPHDDVVNDGVGPDSFAKHHKNSKRAHVLTAISNVITASVYKVSVGVGTPWQDQWLQVDTGSSDTWMFNPAACAEVGCTTGQFDTTKSSTYKNLNKPFTDIYIGANATGGYFTDAFSIGGTYLNPFQMGLATKAANLNTGILGLNGNQGQVYPVLPQAMRNQGLTQTSAFSMYLNDVRAPTGQILFGGYDTLRFTGKMFVMPWKLAVTGLELVDSDGAVIPLESKAFPMQAYIDTGAATTGVPPDVWATIANKVGVNCQGIVFCDLDGFTGSLKFQMGGSNGVTIEMPYTQMVHPLYNSDGSVVTEGGREVCYFGLYQGSMNGGNFLGDSFLRNAYTIYDSDRQQVAMAQAVWNVSRTASDITEITSHGNLYGQASITTIAFASPSSVKSGVCGN